MRTRNIILGAVLAVVGILMVSMPRACINAVVVLVGLMAIAMGGYNLYLINKKEELVYVKKLIVIKSLISIVVGLVAFTSPIVLVKTVASIWKIISYVLAVYLILVAISGFYTGSKLKNTFPAERKRLTSESFISLLIAALLFIIPIEAVGKAFVRIVGIAGLIIGLLLVVVEICVYKRTAVVKDVVVEDDNEADSVSEKSTETTESNTEEATEKIPETN